MASPYEFERRLIGSGYALEPLCAGEAARLGAAFAALDPWARYPYPADKLTAYLAAREPGAPRYGLSLDGTITGAVGLRLDWLRGPYLQFLAVLPACQGQGAGSLVLNWLERAARGEGARNLWVAASDFNERAIFFYERHGFRRVATLEDLVAPGRTELLLRKRLDSA